MKKHLLLMATGALSALSAHADLGTGPYIGATTGLTLKITAKVNPLINDGITPEKTPGIVSGVLAGYQWVVNNTWIWDPHVLLDYTTGRIAAIMIPNQGEAALKPALGMGVGVRFGRLFSPTAAAFIGLDVKCTLSRGSITLLTPPQNVSLKGWYLIPEIGLKGSFTDKLHWFASVHMNMGMTLRGPEAILPYFRVDNKMQGFSLKVGLTYALN